MNERRTDDLDLDRPPNREPRPDLEDPEGPPEPSEQPLDPERR